MGAKTRKNKVKMGFERVLQGDLGRYEDLKRSRMAPRVIQDLSSHFPRSSLFLSHLSRFWTQMGKNGAQLAQT